MPTDPVQNSDPAVTTDNSSDSNRIDSLIQSRSEENDDLPPALPISPRHVLIDGQETLTIKRESTMSRFLGDSAPVPSEADRCGFPRVIGYEIHELLGRGGMGLVYRATELRLKRSAAIKVLPSIRNTPDARARFESEARLLAQVDHPSVARVFEIGATDDGPYIAMEFVPGKSLDRLAGGKPLDPRRAAEITHNLAEALCACHRLGIIHRDVKPANAIISPSGQLKLTDFGLAKLCSAEGEGLTKSGEILGTPSYMAPEQASGMIREFGPATDVYGAGAVLYELLTGRPPFAAPDAMQTMMLALTASPVAPRTILPKIPPDLETICLHCLEKKPSRRYPSCAELVEDLNRFLRGDSIVARPASKARKAMLWVQRHPAWSFAIALSLLSMFAVIAGISLHNAALQKELSRTQKLAREGRELSDWLLTDFALVLDSDVGVTVARTKLAERTQHFLDALNNEVVDDELKLALAESLVRLASLQGRPGPGTLGLVKESRANLLTANKIIQSLANPSSTRARELQSIVDLRLGEFIVEGLAEGDAGSLLLAVRWRILDASGNLTEGIQPFTHLELLNLELKAAIRQGDLKKADGLMLEVERVGKPLLEKQDSPLKYARDFSGMMYSKFALFDLQSRGPELIPTLRSGLARLNELSQGKPSSTAVRLVEANLRRMLGQQLLGQGELKAAESEFHVVRRAWDVQVEKDPKNQDALFNLALAWESLAEVATRESQWPKASDCLEQARNNYEKYAAHTNQKWQEHPETLHLLGLLAQIHLNQDQFDKAREASQLQVASLAKLPQNTLDQKLKMGDALVLMGAIEATAYDNIAKEGGENVANSRAMAYKRATKALETAIRHYEQLKASGAEAEIGNRQLQKTRSILEYLQDEHQKRAASDAI